MNTTNNRGVIVDSFVGVWVSDWDWDLETIEGVSAVLCRVDEFIMLLLSSVGGMAMCGLVD